MKNKKVIETLDAKFADIQKYVNECKKIDSTTKEHIIMMCMQCNDNIVHLVG